MGAKGGGAKGSPIKTIGDDLGLLGLIRAYWVALAPLVQALMACMMVLLFVFRVGRSVSREEARHSWSFRVMCRPQ